MPARPRHYWFADSSKILPLLLAIMVLIAYSNTYGVPFIFDDLDAIRDNPNIQQLWPISKALAAPDQSTVAGRPLVSLTLAMNYAVSELRVWSYHAFNLTIHILNALLVFAILRRTFALPRFSRQWQSDGPWLAGGIALMWALHPLNTEAVTYTIQRTELLVALFLLLTLYSAVRSSSSARRSGWYACGIVSCLCGALAKEVIAGAPLLVWIYDATFLAGNWRKALRERRMLYVGLLLTWVALGVIVYSGPRNKSVGLGLSVTWWDYLKTQSGVILHYLYLTFWPYPLTIDYSDWPIAASLPSVLPQSLIVVTLLGASVWALWNDSVFGFLGAWFFLLLTPTSSVIPIVTEPAAERRMYLPLIALITLVVGGGYGFAGARKRTLVPVCVVLLAAIFAAVTYRRNFDYRTETAIWTDAVEKRPNSAAAHNALGLALLTENRLDDGMQHLQAAIRLDPTHTKAHGNLGFAYAFLGRHNEAIQHYKAALRYDPALAHARYQLALEYLQIGDTASAFMELDRLKKLDGKLAELLAAKLR